MTRRTRAMLYGTVATMALPGFAATAQAADFPAIAKPVADVVSGVTFYGTLDVNGYCQDHGIQAPGNGVPDYFVFANPFIPNSQYCSIGAQGLSVSNVGVAIEKPIGYGITAIGRAETFFNPLTGQLNNGVGSVAQNNNQVFGNQNAFGDSNSAGQFLNGDVYAGLSSATLGTVTIGRLKTLEFDDYLIYDPFAQSLAFSMIGYYGGGAGAGDTENRRWNNSIKYVYDNGPFHVAAQGSTGCNDCAQQGAWSADVGLRNFWGTTGAGSGFSVDGQYAAVKGAVSAFSNFTVTPNPVGSGFLPSVGLLPGVGSENQVIARISDNQEWSVMAKYVWNLGGGGWQDPGMYTKAPASASPPAASTFTLYGGWTHIEFRDPTNPIVNGTNTLGQYVIGQANNFRYETPQIQDWYWVGGKYAVNQWTLTGAYYYQQRNTWQSGAGVENAVNAGIGAVQLPTGVAICNPAVTTAAKQGGVVFATPSTNCSGYFQAASFVVDYAFNKFVDVYTGVNYNDIHGGYIGGQQVTSQVTGVTGLRLKF